MHICIHQFICLLCVFHRWCGYCKRLKPVWDELAHELDGVAILGEVNVDVNKELSERFEISGLPTIKVFHKGTVCTYNGSRELEDMTAYIKSMSFIGSEHCQKVPGEKTPMQKILHPVVKHVKMASSDVVELLDTKKNGMLIVFFMGAIFGKVLDVICSQCCSGKEKQS